MPPRFMKETPIPRRRDLSLEEFRAAYAQPAQPVVLEGAAAHWRAVQEWSVDMLADRWGGLEVEVSRNSGPEGATKRITLGEYVAYMRTEAVHDRHPWYLASWRFRDACPELIEGWETPAWFRENWLDEVPAAVRPELCWMFIGPARAGSWLHLDIAHTSAWNVQVTGRKRWVLFPPEQHALMYNGRVNALEPDLERYPRFAETSPHVAEVGPGDIVFTPSLWWHQTVNLEEGIAVTANYADRSNCEVVAKWLDSHPLYLALHGVDGLATAFRALLRTKTRAD